MSRFRLVLILCLALMVAGCAGHKMALAKGQSGKDIANKSIALLSVKVSNRNVPKCQPDITGALLCPQSETCSRPLPFFHKTEEAYKSVEGSFKEYLLSFDLDPGTYDLRWIGARYSNILVEAGGKVPLDMKIDFLPNKIVYLGHLDVVLREKNNDNETRAGSLFPLIDQAAAGFSSGTFDVVVEDKYDEDMMAFVSEYPVLRDIKVERSLLPKWTRPENRSAK